MGLIKAGIESARSTLGDQWKEFFYCDALDSDVLVAKGKKQVSGRSGNRGSDNIISNGSKIAVANGQAMLIVEQGEVVEFSAEPGEFIFDTSSEPSIFTGNLEDAVAKTFAKMTERFTYGGDTGKDQRVYYFNTKEIPGNKFGTPTPVPFRVIDKNIGLDVDISIRANGMYSFKIVDPILFYTNVSGNVQTQFDRSDIEGSLRSEFLNALQPAFATLSEMGIRYSNLPGHTMELSDAMNKILSEKWRDLRGIEIVSVSINSITAPEEDAKMIRDLQKSAVFKDPAMAGATIVGAQADAMRDAAKNPGGAFGGFVGMNMAQNAGSSAGQFYQMAEDQKQQGGQAQQGSGQPPSGEKPQGQEPEEGRWFCPSCGTKNFGNFCTNCGTKKPEGI